VLTTVSVVLTTKHTHVDCSLCGTDHGLYSLMLTVCKAELSVVMGRSRDWDELQHSWIEWRRLTGPKMRDLFEQVVELSNQAAQLNRESICLCSATTLELRQLSRDGRTVKLSRCFLEVSEIMATSTIRNLYLVCGRIIN
jgi:hypothetical protein